MALANGGVLDGWCSPNGLFGVMNSASQEAVSFTGLVGASSDDWWSSISSVMSMSFAASEGAPCTSSLSLDVEECDVWIDAVEQNYYQLNNHFGSRSGTAVADWLTEDQSCAAEIVSAHSSSPVKRSCISGQQKRPRSDNNLPSPKKRCGATRTTTKEMQSPSKDSQTIAAKNRRERISERLKILQELVPSGTKVDLVTMLEKAIDYVKFLQLQVKVLATDEFWPAQGGQAPGVAQVEQVIDAILSSQTQARTVNENLFFLDM